MRDPKRIARVLEILEGYWQAFPDQRLGQMILNAADFVGIDLFYVEDDVLIRGLEGAYFRKLRPVEQDERVQHQQPQLPGFES